FSFPWRTRFFGPDLLRVVGLRWLSAFVLAFASARSWAFSSASYSRTFWSSHGVPVVQAGVVNARHLLHVLVRAEIGRTFEDEPLAVAERETRILRVATGASHGLPAGLRQLLDGPLEYGRIALSHEVRREQRQLADEPAVEQAAQLGDVAPAEGQRR